LQNYGEAELLGREPERVMLLEILDQSLRSAGSTMVLRGAVGIGKSALLRLAEAEARQRGMSLLSVTAVPTESQLPYAGVGELLGTLLAGQSADSRHLLDAALGRAGEPGSPVERYRLARAALNSVTSSVGHGRVLVVDDAQWLDQESWDVLTFIGRRISEDRVCLLLGMRDSEESETLLSGSGLPEHRLEPLSADAAEALLRAVAPSLAPALAQRVLRETAGNPLGLIELGVAAGELDERGLSAPELPLTERLERAYALTISRLPVLTHSMVLIAALDDNAQLGEVLSASRSLHGPNVTVDDLEPAIAAALVFVDKDSVRFRHPLIRWTVTRSATAAVRLASHAAIAKALDGQEARQVWHLAAAAVGTDAEVAGRLARLAERANEQSSLLSAMRAWERSAQLSPNGALRARRLMSAALAASLLSDYAKTSSLLQEVDEDEVQPADRTELELLRRVSIGFQWPYDQTFPVLADIAARLQAEGRTDLALEHLERMGVVSWWSELQPATRARIVEIVERMNLPELDPTYVFVIATVSPVEHGRVSLERLNRLLLAPPHDVGAAQMLGTAASGVGDLRSSLAFLRSAIASARRLGRLSTLAPALVSQTLVAALFGDVQLALTSAEEAERAALETNMAHWAMQSRLLAAFALALRGDGNDALTTADEIERQLLAAGVRAILCQVAWIRGVAHLAAGRPAAALDELSAMFDPADLHYHEYARFWALSHLAEAAALSGQHERLRLIVDRCEPVSAKATWPALRTSLTYARALLAPDDEADAAYSAALQQISADWPFERARLQLAYGAWLRRHRRVADSRGQLRAAQQVFEGLAAEPWAERARQELRASGERPRRARSAAQTLTPQELQIARLAGSGLTNPEVAEQLFLASSTVSTHLHRVYAKLGVTSRTQLRQALSGG
jgi:DNA-binding CsgD family transcriptional regulator